MRGPRLRSLFVVLLAAVFLFATFSPPALAERVKVGVLSWHVYGPEDKRYLERALPNMLASRLGADPAIRIARSDEISDALKDTAEGRITDASAKVISRGTDCDYLVYGSISIVDEAISLDAKLLRVSDRHITPIFASGTGMSSVVGMVDSIAKETTAKIKGGVAKGPGTEMTYTGKFASEENERGAAREEEGVLVVSKPKDKKRALKWRTPKIDSFYVSMTAADLNGDGRKEVFLAKRTSTLIANVGPKGLEVVAEIPNTSGVENIFISSGDIDRDGTPEVYLASLYEQNPASAVIERKGNSYVISTPRGLKTRLVRVVDIEGQGEVLIGQRFRDDTGFLRDVKILKKSGGLFAKEEDLKLPRRVFQTGIFGTEIFDIDGDGKNEILSLDKSWHLRIYEQSIDGKWEKFWESAEEYGGSLNYVDMPGLSQDSYSRPFIAIRSRMKWGDFDGDGKPEVLVKLNSTGTLGSFAERIKRFKSGVVKNISWDVALLEDNWKTKDHSGYVSDFFVADLDDDGSKEMVLLIVEGIGTYLQKDVSSSYLVAYEFN